MKTLGHNWFRIFATTTALFAVGALFSYFILPAESHAAIKEGVCKNDADCDGLLDSDEDMDGDQRFEPEQGETDPNNPDTDGDGLTDGDERQYKGKVALLLENRSITVKFPSELSPLKADSDGDCLPDGLEAGVSSDELATLLEALPRRPKYEISAKCRAILEAHLITILPTALYRDEEAPSLGNIAALYDADPQSVTDPTSADTDGDGVLDGEEDYNFNGVRDRSDPSQDVVDGDGFWSELSPVNSDSDGDGVLDGDEGDRDGDGALGPNESDPLKPDTDYDGIPDGEEIRMGTYVNVCDSDEDGLSDGIETGKIQPDEINGCRGLQSAGTNFKRPTEMSPLNPDSDGDGLLDGEEDANFNGWLDSNESDPTVVDTDNDGLEDAIEALGDFDGDGMPDFDPFLIQAGGNCSPPKSVGDIDCDQVANARDDDSDNDGCPDSMEGKWVDANNNGIPDVYDFQAKSCPDPVIGRTQGGGSINIGGTGGGGTVGNAPSPSVNQGVGSLGNMADDGGACALVQGMRYSSHVPLACIMHLVLLISLSVLRFIGPIQIRFRRALEALALL